MDPNRKKLVLISVIIVIAILVLANSIYQGQLYRVQRLKTEVAEERAKNRLLGQIRTVEREIDSYRVRLPVERDVEWLRKEVAEIAKESKAKITSISPQLPEDRGLYVRLPVKMGLECDYHQLGKFISNLESSKTFIKIENLNLVAKEAGGGKMVAGVEVVVSTFYLKK